MWQFKKPSQCFCLNREKFPFSAQWKEIPLLQKILNPRQKKWTFRQKKHTTLLKCKILTWTLHRRIAELPFPFTVSLSSAFRQSQTLCSYFNYNKSRTRFQIPNSFQIQNPNLISLTNLTWTVASSLTISLEPYLLVSVFSLVKDETQIPIPNCRILNSVKRKYSLSFPLSLRLKRRYWFWNYSYVLKIIVICLCF
jgi:hypothetical protein